MTKCCQVRPLPTRFTVSVDTYLVRLEKYITKYKEALTLGDEKLAHTCRNNINRQKSRLLNFMSEDEYQEWYNKFRY